MGSENQYHKMIYLEEKGVGALQMPESSSDTELIAEYQPVGYIVL